MMGSVFAVPVDQLPDKLYEVLPADTTPIAIRGRALVGVAFVSYEPGGALAYSELLAAVMTRSGVRPRVTIPDIWVDSEASLAGGRELWNIPKALGRFDRRLRGADVCMRMKKDGRQVASLDARVMRRLRPGWQTASLSTAQRLDDSTVVAHSAIRMHPCALRTRWEFPPEGPLGYLSGHRPLLSVALTDMAVSFGVRVERLEVVQPSWALTAAG